jgi:hypothetical protein
MMHPQHVFVDLPKDRRPEVYRFRSPRGKVRLLRPILAHDVAGLVEANQRTIAVAWPRVDGQHVFHSGYERAVGLRRDDPVLAAMGLKSVFLSARPIVLSLARSTMPSSTTLFSNNRKVQRARPLGGLPPADHLLNERDRGQFVPSRRRRVMANVRAERLLKTPAEPSPELRIPALQLKREWSPWPQFGSDPGNPRELSKG